MPRTLIVLRDQRLGRLLEEALRAKGHSTALTGDPARASALADYEAFDLAIVDAALETAEGFDLLRESCTGPAAPAVIAVDTREPLDAGALQARLRDPPERPADWSLAAGGVELDPWKRRARTREGDVALTDREFSLLQVLLRHPGRVLSREELHLHAWGHEQQAGSNAVEVYVGYLRRKLGAELIETVRGRGYRLNPGHRG